MNRQESASPESQPDWDGLLDEFRALGGTAENVRLGYGPLGRGLFAIDSAKPVCLHTPPNLLVPSKDTELRDGKLTVRDSAPLGERERKFFAYYQKHFSWGAGGFDQLWQAQTAWNALPQNIKDKLQEIGPVVPDRFSEPTPSLCHSRYLNTRQFSYRGRPVVMPMIELANHRDQAGQLECEDGLKLAGSFADEIFFDYSPDDCWGMALRYDFFAPRRWAHSLELEFAFEGRRIRIARDFNRVERFNGVPVPVVFSDGETSVISFLVLGHVKFPHIPRSVFHHLAQKLAIKRANELFDLIQHHNRAKLLSFLRLSEGMTGAPVAMLRQSALQQLATLSAYFGAQTL